MVKLLNLSNNTTIFLGFLYLLGILFVITALLMILTESSVHAILYLMFLFLYLTELTILLKMEFLALIFIIVYIGAVCVLMLFHIKLIKTFVHRYDNISNKDIFLPFFFVSILLPFLQVMTLALDTKKEELSNNFKLFDNYNSKILEEGFAHSYVTSYDYTSWIHLLFKQTSTELFGVLLYGVYSFYLILGAFILLVAMIGSIFLTLLKKKNKAFQEIDKQVSLKIFNTLKKSI